MRRILTTIAGLATLAAVGGASLATASASPALSGALRLQFV